jgi:hypothetical protein
MKNQTIEPAALTSSASAALATYIRALEESAFELAKRGNTRGADLLWAASEHCHELATIATDKRC